MSKIVVRLTPAETGHLLGLLRDSEREGSYYGNREQYYERTRRLIATLETAAGIGKDAPTHG